MGRSNLITITSFYCLALCWLHWTIIKMHSYSLPNCNLYLLLVLSIFFGSIFLSCLCNLTIVESTRHIFRSWSTHYPKHNVSLIYFLFILIVTSSSLHHICFPAVLVSPCRWLISHYVCCSWNATYESLLGTRQPFSKPIPLTVSVLCIFMVPCWDFWGENAKITNW